VHRSLTTAVAGVQIIDCLGGRPHFGVRLLLNTGCKDDNIWTMLKPRQIPSLLPAGCVQHAQDFSLSLNLRNSALSTSNTTQALKQWYTSVEFEFCDIMGLDEKQSVQFSGRANGTKFVQRPLLGRRACQNVAATDAPVRWRKLATWLTTILRASKVQPCPAGLAAHAEVLKRKIQIERTWHLSDKLLQGQITEFTRRCSNDFLASSESLTTAVKAANAVAKALEEHNALAKAKEWNSKIAGADGQCGKTAYNFAKGAIGHHDSPPETASSINTQLDIPTAPRGADHFQWNHYASTGRRRWH